MASLAARIVWLAALATAALSLSGCAVGRTDRGSVVFGPELDTLGQNTVEVAREAAAWLPHPWDKVAGAGVIGLAGWLGRERGRHTGWTEATGTPGSAKPAGGAA